MKIIPLFGSGQSAKSFTVTDDRRVNVYYELSPDQEKSKIRIYGTPGTMSFASYGAAPARGLHVIGTTLYVVAGNQFLSINTNGAVTVIGTLLTSAGLVEMADNGVQLIIVDGQSGYIYTLTTGNYSIGVVNAGDFRVIASANFPNGATTVDFNTGFFLVEKINTGQFWKSGSYDGTSWLGTDFATAESNPDNLIAVTVDQGFVILFGTASIEFWQNTGVQGFPFAPVQGATQEIGIAAKYSRAKWNNTVAFLASNLQGGYQVYATGAGGVTKISNNDIDGLIASFINPSDAIGMSYVVDGHAMYQLNFQRDKRSLVYDASTGVWSEAQSGLDEFARHIANQAVAFNGGVYVSDYTTGSIYKLDENTFTDNSQPVKRMIQTRHIHDEGNVLAIDEIFLDMETGVGLQAGTTGQTISIVQFASASGVVPVGGLPLSLAGVTAGNLIVVVAERKGNAAIVFNAENSPTLADTSGTYVLTAGGAGGTESASVKFGSFAYGFGTKADYLTISTSSSPGSALMPAASSSFTISFWINPISIGGGTTSGELGFYGNNNPTDNGIFGFFLAGTGTFNVGFKTNSGGNYFTGGVTLTIGGGWQHVEVDVQQSGGTLNIYSFLNGVLKDTTTKIDSMNIGLYATEFSLGNGPAAAAFLGNTGTAQVDLDDIAIFYGVALHTSGFTPPGPLSGSFGAVTITDGQGTYGTNTTSSNGGTSSVTIANLPNANAGTHSLLVDTTGNSTVDSVIATAFEISGTGINPTFDIATPWSGTNIANGAPINGSITNTQSGIVFAGAVTDAFTTSPSIGSPFTSIAQGATGGATAYDMHSNASVLTIPVASGGNGSNIAGAAINIKGQTAVVVQGSDPKIMVQVSKDNGHTFGTERLMSIGKVGQYRLRATLRRFGSARDFVFRFKMTDPVKFACTYGAATLRGLGK